MKKVIGLVLVICMCTMLYPQSVNIMASEMQQQEEFNKEEIFNAKDVRRQEEIDRIFWEMNQDVLEKANLEYLDTCGMSSRSEERNETDDYFKKEKMEEWEAQLEALGVHKINPDNPGDMEMLAELFQSAEQINPLSDPWDTAPDLSNVTKAFSVYCYDNTYQYKNEEHICRYLRVVDNKGSGLLTHRKDFNAAIVQNTDKARIANILKYNFGYIFSKFLGTHLGATADWLLGNVFAALDGVDPSDVSVSGEAPFYVITCISVTEMVYHYYYDGIQWRFIGTSSNVSMVKRDSFGGNVDGKAKIEDEYEEWESSSGGTWSSYVRNYVNVKDKSPEYYKVDKIGTLTIRGFDKNFEYTPKFAELPGYLLLLKTNQVDTDSGLE